MCQTHNNDIYNLNVLTDVKINICNKICQTLKIIQPTNRVAA